MMRKIICMLLIVAFCVSMACPVFAATKSPASNNKPSYNSDNNPKTGDMIMTYVIVMLIALLALVAVAVLYRKVFHN